MKLVVLGPVYASGRADPRAAALRGLLESLATRDHEILVLEQGRPSHACRRDRAEPGPFRLEYYSGVGAIDRWSEEIVRADAVIVTSGLADGARVGNYVQRRARGVVAFYDMHSAATLGRLERGEFDHLSPPLIPGYDVYLSSIGGPILDYLEHRYGSPAARALCASADAQDRLTSRSDQACRAVAFESYLYEAGAVAALALSQAGWGDWRVAG